MKTNDETMEEWVMRSPKRVVVVALILICFALWECIAGMILVAGDFIINHSYPAYGFIFIEGMLCVGIYLVTLSLRNYLKIANHKFAKNREGFD